MADPLSITASIIAVATLAYKSTEALHNTINTVKDATKIFDNLNTDIATLKDVLGSLVSVVEETSTVGNLPEAQLRCLQALSLPLDGCSKACDNSSQKSVI